MEVAEAGRPKSPDSLLALALRRHAETVVACVNANPHDADGNIPDRIESIVEWIKFDWAYHFRGGWSRMRGRRPSPLLRSVARLLYLTPGEFDYAGRKASALAQTAFAPLPIELHRALAVEVLTRLERAHWRRTMLAWFAVPPEAYEDEGDVPNEGITELTKLALLIHVFCALTREKRPNLRDVSVSHVCHRLGLTNWFSGWW